MKALARCGSGRHQVTVLCTLALTIVISGCASKSLDRETVTMPPSHAEAPARSGLLAELAAVIQAENGEEYSGFHILDSSFDGLYWRLALIDSATTSLDIQTYLWYPDASGKLMLERAIHAAQRGVKVRLLVDDLILQGHDQFIANLEAQPNIEFRMFNPWEDRTNLVERAGEMIAEMERLNSRMHDKLMIVDGRAAVIGGRNLGDHYFGLSDAYNFHDTDLLGIGYIATQANGMFDMFWNSEWVESSLNLSTRPNKAIAQQQWQNLLDNSANAPQLEAFPRKPRDWSDELTSFAARLRIGSSKLVYDETSGDQISQNVISSMFNFFTLAQSELLIMNAYVIPSQTAIDCMQKLEDRNVEVSILTNSLASHDVPAVNSHYEPWRDDFIRAGVDLYEMRADPAIQQSIVDVPPVAAGFTGLHSKSAVVDRRFVFIGSMNLDPRSARINTEMGAFVDSPALAEDMAAIIKRDMSGENAWRVKLDEDGDTYWQNSVETVTTQPSREVMQRVMNTLMKLGPKEQY